MRKAICLPRSYWDNCLTCIISPNYPAGESLQPLQHAERCVFVIYRFNAAVSGTAAILIGWCFYNGYGLECVFSQYPETVLDIERENRGSSLRITSNS